MRRLPRASRSQGHKPESQQRGSVCRGRERKLNTEIRNRRAAEATHKMPRSRNQNTRKEKHSQLQFPTERTPCKTSPRAPQTPSQRRTSSTSSTHLSARRCPALKTQDPLKYRLNNSVTPTRAIHWLPRLPLGPGTLQALGSWPPFQLRRRRTPRLRAARCTRCNTPSPSASRSKKWPRCG